MAQKTSFTWTAIIATELLLATKFAGLSFAQGWVKTSAPSTNWISIASSADGSKLIAAASSGFFTSTVAGLIFQSPDFGATWRQTTAPLADWYRVVCSADGEKIFATAYAEPGGKSFWISTNGGNTWAGSASLTNAYLLDASADGRTLLAAGDSFPYFATSTNGGADWNFSSLPIATFPEGVGVSADGTRLIVCELDALSTFLWMFISTDSGQTWTQNAGPDNSSNYGVAFTAAKYGRNLIAAVNSLGVFTSVDWGGTWQTSGPNWPTGSAELLDLQSRGRPTAPR